MVVMAMITLACSQEETTSPQAQINSAEPLATLGFAAEEELFGQVFWDGVPTSAGVTLDPVGNLTQSRLLMTGPGAFDNSMSAQAGRTDWLGRTLKNHWGWSDPAASDGGCQTPSVHQDSSVKLYRTGNRALSQTTQEVHPLVFSLEAHCVRPGTYRLQVDLEDMTLDNIPWFKPGSAPLTIAPKQIGLEPDSSVIDPDGANVQQVDLVVNVEFLTSPSPNTETAVLEVALASDFADPSPFAAQNPANGQSNSVFRFATDRSTSTWTNPLVASNANLGRSLSRLFWDYSPNGDLNNVSGFYDGFLILRQRRFKGILECRVIGHEFKRPDERVANVADATVKIGIGVACPTGPDLMPMPKALSPTSVDSGGTVTIDLRLHDVGNSAIPASFNTRVFLAPTTGCSGTAIDLATFVEAAGISGGSYRDASHSFSVNAPAGTYFVCAELNGLLSDADSTNDTVQFSDQLSVTGGAVMSMVLFSGNNQTGTVDSALAEPLKVQLIQGTAPVANHIVTFTTTAGSIAAPNSMTDANGIATSGAWTLGSTPGTDTATATALGSGIIGNPVSFTATAIAPPSQCQLNPAVGDLSPVGSSVKFSGSPDCAGTYMEVSPAGSFGFNSTCTQTTKTNTFNFARFFVYSCGSPDEGDLYIYSDATKTTILQDVSLVSFP